MATETTAPKTMTIHDIMRMRRANRANEERAIAAEHAHAMEIIIAERQAQNARF